MRRSTVESLLRFSTEVFVLVSLFCCGHTIYKLIDAQPRIRSMNTSYQDPELRSMVSKLSSKRSYASQVITRHNQSKASKEPPYSELYCFGNERSERTCRGRNVYFDKAEGKYFIIADGRNGFLWNTPLKAHSYPLVDLTSIDDHNVFFWTYTQHKKLPDDYDGQTMGIVNGPSLLLSRFLPFNIMHAIHDDILGFYSHQDLWPQLRKDSQVFFVDGHRESDQDQLYSLTFPKPCLVWPSLEPIGSWDPSPQFEDDSILMLEDVVLGNNKRSNWYQYGFGKPQGPIPNFKATGWRVRWAAKKIMESLKIPAWSSSDQNSCIAIFSRRSNRLILNEDELADALTSHFHLPICWIRMEDNTIPELIEKLTRAKMAFGMHGALLILAMFMPEGSSLIEGYPYGVPAENYTPYRTLCNLSGMNINYAAWTNQYPELSIGHPEYPPSRGGLEETPDELKNFILTSTTIPPHPCCSDPHWLYRIYQDTSVTIPEIVDLFESLNSDNKPNEQDKHNKQD